MAEPASNFLPSPQQRLDPSAVAESVKVDFVGGPLHGAVLSQRPVAMIVCNRNHNRHC